jgi:hypothetical protein
MEQVSRDDAGMRDAHVDAARDRSVDVGKDAAAESPRDSSTNLRPDLGPGDPRADLPRDSAGDIADATRDLPQDQARELPIRDSGVEFRNDVVPADLAVRETAGDSPLAGRPDSQSAQDSTSGRSLCVVNITVCSGNTVNTAINSLHCGGCDRPCDPSNVCSDGICLPASSDWPTLQHDVQHSGENPDETGVPPLCLAWSLAVDPGVALGPVVVENGRLYATSADRFGKNAPLRVLSVSDGSDLWQYNFGDVYSVGWPSVFSGSVYIANGQPAGVYGPPLFWATNATTGATQWVAKLSAQWERYWPPIRVGDIVYTNAGAYGGMYGISATDGAQVFFQGLDQYDQWSPAYFGGHIFSYIAGKLRKHDPATGAILTTVTVPFTWNGWSMQAAPAFGPILAYVIAPPALIAIDTGSDTIAWTAEGSFNGTPAVAGGIVYGISAGTLQARDGDTGTLLWTFPGDTALSFPPVVASGYVYVASTKNVYAVDIATHAQGWTDSVGGWLSLAAHKLFVAAVDGTLSAYQLSSE